jgi:hypothetical protein
MVANFWTFQDLGFTNLPLPPEDTCVLCKFHWTLPLLTSLDLQGYIGQAYDHAQHQRVQ